ncbi:MAG: bifunctional glutamine synthetase adenylyltransferase/deadenyltransferase [Desulfobacteraceae bacterium IS3]|nr:MAG: bifunctional glutamine synthetase adenylyltransferase/deadenyltransferase [Desulfobacteraceae bacterium IS3]
MIAALLQTQAQRRWQEFCQASQEQNIAVPDEPELINTAQQVFAFSDFISKACIREPKLLQDLVNSGDLGKAYEPDEYCIKLKSFLADVRDEASLIRRLRKFRRREMVRIAWRDLGGNAELSETMSDLSHFADACVQTALCFLYDWQTAQFGIPVNADGESQPLIVLGMGKLGAGELNFSSDIDLIFTYPELGETTGKSQSAKSPLERGQGCVTNDEFFVKLCRKLLTALSANTEDGFVFRVDMDLRPYGEGGPLVMNFDAMESYYQIQGREWERYAWIKARIIAGDKAAGEKLLQQLKPFVYRRYLDYGVFESLREMKGKISLEVQRHGMQDNIKLGSGGIREIEFFGQIFQLIRGGVVPALQTRRIQDVLPILVEEGFIEKAVCEELLAGYVFLRNTEHRLQEYADMQTHQLPPDELGQACLAASMGFENWKAFSQTLFMHREKIHWHFNTLLELRNAKHSHDDIEKKLQAVWQNSGDEERHTQTLSEAGFKHPHEVMQRLDDFRNGMSTRALSPKSRERLDRLIPLLLKETGLSEQSDSVFDRVIDLIKSIERRACYISLLLEKPQTLTHIVKLANTSSWILSFLSQHPVLLDELLDSRTLYTPPGKPELERELRHRLEQIPPDDLEHQMETLRVFKQVNLLRVAVADINNALPLMKVSDHLSYIAEVILKEVLDLAWNYMVEKHGEPECRISGCQRGFAVIAYGKLGGFELGYNSDIDLVFIHAGTAEETKGGRRPIDSGQFFARLGQRVVHILTAHTSAGILYDTDMRLRPDGSSGPLVCHIDSFGVYQDVKAWTWEKQAILRARPVSGDSGIAERFESIRKQVLTRPRQKAKLQEEVRSMRQKMRHDLASAGQGMFDLKQDEGGMVDIEFLVQYLVLLNANQYPEIVQWTDKVRLLRMLSECGAIDEYDAYFLRETYLSYRAFAHKLSLQQKPAKVPDTQFHAPRKRVRELWNYFIESSS